MAVLKPEKLHVVLKESVEISNLTIPRKYTLTHSDSTGDLFLTIGIDYDYDQISSLYTRFMRDEVLAEWQEVNDQYELHLYLHISGGFVFGWAAMRDKIFRYHLPLVLQAILYGDKKIIEENPNLSNSKILVHYKSKKKKYDKIEYFGQIKDIRYL